MGEMFDSQTKIGLIGLPRNESIDFDSKQIGWQQSSIKGFYYKSLMQDQHACIRTLLMKVEPGAFAPMHAHDEIEQIYLLEGSIYDQDKSYSHGEFVVRAAGVMHSTGSVDGAIVLLFYSPPNDV